MLTIDTTETKNPKLHHYLLGSVGPRPICFASTIDKDGNRNLAPFSFFNVFSSNPPIAVFSPARSGRTGQQKDTYNNVKEVPQKWSSILLITQWCIKCHWQVLLIIQMKMNSLKVD